MAQIQRGGPIPFARFMELALYQPRLGYYMRTSNASGPSEAASEGKSLPAGERIGERIGWSGDYYTSSDVHPLLGQALARQARQVDELLGRPAPFTVVEMGPGKGLLARDFLAGCSTVKHVFGDRLRYVLIERSPAMRTAQRANLGSWLDLVSWVDRLDDLEAGSVAGLMYSNELVDALPVHRMRIIQGEPKEMFVAYQDGQFCECFQDLSTPELERYLERLAQQGIRLPEGYTTEINLAALNWMREVGRALDRGIVLTIDYGHTAQDRYGHDRQRGTFLCYYRQTASEDPFRRLGDQDMTAHVDFTSLATVGEEVGLHLTGFTNQMSFLIGLGAEQMLGALEPGSLECQRATHLLRPGGMGQTFKVLVQHKGIPAPQLDGLRYKPFFVSALAAQSRSV